jgi:integrase
MSWRFSEWLGEFRQCTDKHCKRHQSVHLLEAATPLTSVAPVRPMSMFDTSNGDRNMARRRSQRKGYVSARGRSWLLQWREDVRSATGQITRAKFSQVIADREGPQAVSKRQAERIAWDQILSKLDTASLHPQSLATIEEFVRQKFEPNHVAALTPGGRAHYADMLRHILPALGGLRLRETNLDRVQKFFNELREKSYFRGKAKTLESGEVIQPKEMKYARQTLVHVKNALSAIFRYARELDFFAGRLPTEGLRLGEMRRQQRRALSEKQVRDLLAVLESPYREMAIVIGCTGMRIGELCGLRWKRVLWDKGLFEVVESYNPRRGYGETKTSSSDRLVPIVLPVAEILRDMQKSTRWNGPDDPVFAGKNGRPIDRTNAQTRFLRPAGEAIGLPGVCWHALRHTLGTMVKDEGVDLGDRKLILGHATDDMALHYSHASVEKMRDPLERIAARLLKPEEPLKATIQ